MGLGIGACGGRTGPLPEPRVGRYLPPVLASWDRVIRTTVGLRPYRPGGFRVEAERFDDRTVIHNYGHGGAGMSLSWGTSALAADLALGHASRRAAVIGCGVAGLTAARQLQRRGFEVTIYAKTVPPDTTSNMSWASFTPTSGLVAIGREAPEWPAQFRAAAEVGYRQLQLLVGRGYGVSWVDSYTFSDQLRPRRRRGEAAGGDEEVGGESALLPEELQTGRLVLQPGQHPFPARFATRRPALRIEPSIYLDALVRDALTFGARLVIRTFDSPRDFGSLEESLIVNCTGLGSRELVSDSTMEPVKGQLTLLVPQTEIQYSTLGGVPSRGVGGFIHMMPRRDGIALGGTNERGEWSLEPNEEARRRVVEEHIALFRAMRAPPGGGRIATSFVPDPVPALESFFGLQS